MGDGGGALFLIGGGIGIALALLFAILLPLSFEYLDYHEMGFVRSRTTGNVDTSRVYGGGRHLIGPDKVFKIFPASAQSVDLYAISVAGSDRLEVVISCTFQYQLRMEQLVYLHNKYDIRYEGVIRNSAIAALKNGVTEFNTRDFFDNRKEIERVILEELQLKLGGTCCPATCPDMGVGCSTCDENCEEPDMGMFSDVLFFQFGDTVIPSEIGEQFLSALIRIEDAEKEGLLQEASVKRIDTEKMVQKIINSANELSQNATAQSNLIVSRANATATQVVEESHNQGLAMLYASAGISSSEHKASINYIRSLKQQPNAHLSINFDTYMTGGY